MNNNSPHQQLSDLKKIWPENRASLERLLCDFGGYPDVQIGLDGTTWVEGGCMGDEQLSEARILSFLEWLAGQNMLGGADHI
ncbi:MAG: hypothetical protein HQL72_08410 [Magnetococcales bacterium]|nr:hypothetical protein [Magnetococcales bacterium]